MWKENGKHIIINFFSIVLFFMTSSKLPSLNSLIFIISELMFFKALWTEKHEILFIGLFDSIELATMHLGLSVIVVGKVAKKSSRDNWLLFFLLCWWLEDNRANLYSLMSSLMGTFYTDLLSFDLIKFDNSACVC